MLYSLDDSYQNSTGTGPDTPVITQLVVQTGAHGPGRHWKLVMEVVRGDGEGGEMTTAYWMFDSTKSTPTMIRSAGSKPVRTMNEVITRLLAQKGTTVFAVCSRPATENGMHDVTVQGLLNMQHDATSQYRLEAIKPANWLIYLGGKQPTSQSADQAMWRRLTDCTHQQLVALVFHHVHAAMVRFNPATTPPPDELHWLPHLETLRERALMRVAVQVAGYGEVHELWDQLEKGHFSDEAPSTWPAGAIDAAEHELGIHVLEPTMAQRAFEDMCLADTEDVSMKDVHCADLHRHIVAIGKQTKDASRIEETMIELCVRKTLGGGRFASEVLAIVSTLVVTSRGTKQLTVCHLYVAPGWRGKGIGSALLETATAIARSRGCSAVKLGTAFQGRKVEAVQEWLLHRGFKRQLGYRAGGIQVMDDMPVEYADLRIEEARVRMRVYVTQSQRWKLPKANYKYTIKENEGEGEGGDGVNGTTDVNGTGDAVGTGDDVDEDKVTPNRSKRQKKEEAAFWKLTGELTDPDDPEYEDQWTKISCPAGWVLLEKSVRRLQDKVKAGEQAWAKQDGTNGGCNWYECQLLVLHRIGGLTLTLALALALTLTLTLTLTRYGGLGIL